MEQTCHWVQTKHLFNFAVRRNKIHIYNIALCTQRHWKKKLTIFFYFKFCWDTIDIQHFIILRCTACWFDTFIYCGMITIKELANTSITTHNYNMFFVIRTTKISSPSSFEVYKTVSLTMINNHRLCCALEPKNLFTY